MRPGVNGINVVALCLVLFFSFLSPLVPSLTAVCSTVPEGRRLLATCTYLPRYIPEVSSGRGVAYCMCVGTLGLGCAHADSDSDSGGYAAGGPVQSSPVGYGSGSRRK